MNRHYKTLELDKILERLAAKATLDDATIVAGQDGTLVEECPTIREPVSNLRM